MKRICSLFSLLLLLSIPLLAQETTEKEYYRPIRFFIGIQPGFGVEAYDEHRYTYDINIIPIQIEYSINNKLSLRLMPRADLQIKPYNFGSELSRVGLGITIPYHFAKKNSEEGHRGFYAGPFGSLTMHNLDNFISTTAAVEMGYYFLFNSVFTLNIGAQYGRTIQMNPDDSYNLILRHQAAVIALGIWF